MKLSKTVLLIATVVCTMQVHQLIASEPNPPPAPSPENDTINMYQEIVLQILIILQDLSPVAEEEDPALADLQQNAHTILVQIQNRILSKKLIFREKNYYFPMHCRAYFFSLLCNTSCQD